MVVKGIKQINSFECNEGIDPKKLEVLDNLGRDVLSSGSTRGGRKRERREKARTRNDRKKLYHDSMEIRQGTAKQG